MDCSRIAKVQSIKSPPPSRNKDGVPVVKVFVQFASIDEAKYVKRVRLSTLHILFHYLFRK